MTGVPTPELRQGLGALRKFAGRPKSGESCELCSAPVGEEHRHLIDPISRRLICACEACSILFTSRAGAKYKRVPRRIRFLPDFRLSPSLWAGLAIPINLAFFFRSSPAEEVVALYPSPAGATQTLLSPDAWDEIVQANPAAGEIEPDVEALMVNRLGEMRGFAAEQYFILPMDECYKLVGLVRRHWHGLSGGEEVWREVQDFFAGMKERSDA